MPASAQAESSAVTRKIGAQESHARLRTPEEWYADIEALRAAGRFEEADAELAGLKAAYPDWQPRQEQQDP
jgi:outer membrane protein assembly factor BamD (BamD/ComL family)